MTAWRYELKVGAELRKAIDREDYADVLDKLADAWREIHDQFPDDYDEDDLERDLDDIDIQREDLDPEEIDYLLSNLYDYCDSMRIWVAW